MMGLRKLRTVHWILLERETFRLAWLNAAQSIMLVEVWGMWDWEDAQIVFEIIAHEYASQTHDCFTIVHLLPNAGQLPSGAGAMTHIKRLIAIDPPNERLVLFVGLGVVISALLNTVSRAYGLRQALDKFRFPRTLDEAFTLISAYQLSK